jgi:hypothetical protein
MAEGDLEGSPSDPLTTDPKGEACHASGSPKTHVIRNTPALIQRQGANGKAATLDPWFVTGLTEGEGCFCVPIAIRAKLRARLEVRPSFSLSLNEKDLGLLEDLQAFFGRGWIRESKGDRTYKFEVRAIRELTGVILPHLSASPCGDARREAVQASHWCARWLSKATICSATVCERLWASPTR